MLYVFMKLRIYISPASSLYCCKRPMEHVLLTFCTHLGHAKLTGRGFCVLEFLESREVHQADLIFGSTLYFVVLMDRGTKDVLMAPHVPSLPLKQNV
ncbi:hypothetical protein MTR67_027547 [Solanum verrucosum]|uniref:Uncharacterized protein n=1 Tax=Solanum verrucosum TaxID=315347 RepID=A0AAF0TUY7_SOLVR|nr:hypothetical protein MTR67_027547 [Solanum verrucosum]